MLDFGKLTILIVEDTAPMNKLVRSIVETLGFKSIHQAYNGQEGFEKFCKERPDIVLTDWVMEPGGGIELTKMIRTSSQSPNKMAPIIMLTGYSAIHRVVQARDAGVTEFLVKPFTARDLAKRIAYVINKPRDFIHAPGYFGPDRRRIINPDFTGSKKRKND